jgi:hypothetical protein
MNQQQHEMVLEKTHPSGAEEWNCPTCGRRLLMSWEPNFKKTILEAGDDYAIHSGGKGGLSIGPMQAIPINNTLMQEEPMTPDEDPDLAPWVAWLEESDFENLWNNDEVE